MNDLNIWNLKEESALNPWNGEMIYVIEHILLRYRVWTMYDDERTY